MRGIRVSDVRARPARLARAPGFARRCSHALGSVSFVLAALGALRCDNPYPLAPTACDDWCLATQRASCEEDYPEGCVSNCEQRSIGRRFPRCEAPWQALTQCYLGAADSDFQCIDDESRPKPICIDERVAYSACASPLRGSCLQVCLRQAVECAQPERVCEGQCRLGTPSCQQLEQALYDCELREPVDCTDPQTDTRDVSEIPCIAEIGALLDCAGFEPPPAPPAP
jgi:hypothetical protein